MNIKKTPAVIGLVTASAVALIAFYAHKSSSPEQGQVAVDVGVVNPEAAKAGLRTEPLPQISERRFEPPPSLGTGSYTEPVASKDATKKDSDK